MSISRSAELKYADIMHDAQGAKSSLAWTTTQLPDSQAKSVDVKVSSHINAKSDASRERNALPPMPPLLLLLLLLFPPLPPLLLLLLLFPPMPPLLLLLLLFPPLPPLLLLLLLFPPMPPLLLLLLLLLFPPLPPLLLLLLLFPPMPPLLLLSAPSQRTSSGHCAERIGAAGSALFTEGPVGLKKYKIATKWPMGTP